MLLLPRELDERAWLPPPEEPLKALLLEREELEGTLRLPMLLEPDPPRLPPPDPPRSIDPALAPPRLLALAPPRSIEPALAPPRLLDPLRSMLPALARSDWRDCACWVRACGESPRAPPPYLLAVALSL
jgi:hypothetical protein